MVALTTRTNEICQKTFRCLTLGSDLNIFFNGEIIKKFEGLPCSPKTQSRTTVHGQGVDFLPFKFNATSGRNKSCDAINKGRLAGAIGTNQADKFSLFDGDVNIVNCSQSTERH